MCSSTSKAQTRSKPRGRRVPRRRRNALAAPGKRKPFLQTHAGDRVRLDPDVVVAQGQPRADRSLARPNLEDRPDVAERFQDAGDDAVAQPPVQGSAADASRHQPGDLEPESPAATLAGRNASTARS